jgi:hypothetical protein
VRRLRAVGIPIVLSLVWVSGTSAQSTQSLVPTTDDQSLFLDIPAGANAATGDSGGGAGTFGIQLFRRDRLLLSASASIGVEQTVTKDFAASVLNPSPQGSSFQISGNYLWPLPHKGPKAILLVGLGGKAILTRSKWAEFPATDDSRTVGGLFTSLTPIIVFATRTLEGATPQPPPGGGTPEPPDEYQFSLEIGPTWRSIGGDLGQNDPFRRTFLATDSKSFTGFSFTFAFRINSWQPFAAVTWFRKPNNTHIGGLTGTQALIGINVISKLHRSRLS